MRGRFLLKHYFKIQFSLVTCLFLGLVGCNSYITPGNKAELTAFAPESIQEGFAIEPTRPFPASVAAVRIQAKNYTNYNLNRVGGIHNTGTYTVVLTREVEVQSHFKRLSNLEQINDITPLNRLLLPPAINSSEDICLAASKLRADLVFVYTFDTNFFDENTSMPLSVISLGLSPNRRITATTTVSALLLDTRTGFIYGAFEATARETKVSSSWGSMESSDKARLETEKAAFEELIAEVEASWPRLIESYGPS